MPEEPHVAYEKNDLGVGGIIAFAVGLVMIVFAVHVVTAWLFDALSTRARRVHVPPTPLAAKERPKLPRDLAKIPAPVLQIDELTDLAEMRRAEERRLHSYGWVDRDAGIVHIPIAEAMRLLADPETAKAHGIRVDVASKKKGARP